MPELIKDDSSYTFICSGELLVVLYFRYTDGVADGTPFWMMWSRYSIKSDGLGNISPFQLGAGVSYLTKMLIMCLRAKKNDVILIENPEIHLHPASQAKVGEFLAFIVRAGIRVIIETHCEHLIYIRSVMRFIKKRFLKDDVTILYKEGIRIRSLSTWF